MNNLNDINSNIELQHILIELTNNRLQHMRHFIDQYYCYTNGYVTNGKADWKKIYWSKFVSEKALLLNEKNNSKVVKEHVVPLKTIINILDGLPKESISSHDIKMVLDSLVIFATITKEEDQLLNSCGLKSRMPMGIIDFNQILNDKFARYNHVGIKIIEL